MKSVIFFIILSSSVLAQDINTKEISIPLLTSSVSKDLVWNKWDTNNFIILSIDKSQGLKLKNEIEKIHSNFLSKWSLQQTKNTPCKLICVPNEEFLLKFFNLKNPHIETKDGDFSAIWVDFERIEKLPSLVAQVYLANSSKSFVIQRGISLLEKPIQNIKQDVADLKELDYDSIFSVDQKKWQSFSSKEKEIYDRKCCLVCLFLRKEFGGDLFSKFLLTKQDTESLLSTYGFKNKEQLFEILNNYSKNITEDIVKNKIPNKYLNIE